MTKPYREMTIEELSAELDFWWAMITSPKGPGSASNDAREGALRLYQEAAAWRVRRVMGE
jgi:hypothetical protein